MKRLFILLLSLFLAFGLFACGGGGDDDGGDDPLTVSDFVGQWDGPVTVASESGNESGYAILTVNIDGTGSVSFTPDEGGDEAFVISAFSVIDDILHFDLPNSDPNDPDCTGWDMELTLTITGTIGGGGTICGEEGTESVTFSGSLAFSSDIDDDYAAYLYTDFFTVFNQAYVGVSDAVIDGIVVSGFKVSTDGFDDGQFTGIIIFDDHGVSIDDGDFHAISANKDYIIGADASASTDGATIGFGINNDFTGADNSLLKGSFRVIGITKHRIDSEVRTRVMDEGPGTGPFDGDGHWASSPAGDVFYDISDAGAMTIDDGTGGQINENGTVFIQYNYDADEGPFIFLSCAIKESSELKSEASLYGTYSFSAMTGDSSVPEDIGSIYGTIFFDGEGGYTLQSDFLETHEDDYFVSENGDIIVFDGEASFTGRISQDNELVTLGYTSTEIIDPGPPPTVIFHEPFILFAVKQPD